MEINNVTVCGCGVLGGQIVFQSAYHEFNVVAYDVSEEVLNKAKTKFQWLGEVFKKDLGSKQSDIEGALSRISYSTDLSEATKEADLVIEAIPENLEIKKDFYKKLGQIAPTNCIFCTNTSTLLPGQFAQETGRPELFLALHFANNIWRQNVAEIMGHENTNPVVFDTVVEFAKAIGMVAIPLKKEQPGYIMNSLLIPLLRAGMSLYVNGIADPATIDKTWMKATGAPTGPFGIYDIIGMMTTYNVNLTAAKNGDVMAKKVVKLLKENFIDKGKLGLSTGEGFYTYPNPEYLNDDFLKP